MDREMLDEYVPQVIFYEGEGYPFYEFVSVDSPTVTGRMFTANVEPLYDWQEKKVIGFRVHVDAALTPSSASPLSL